MRQSFDFRIASLGKDSMLLRPLTQAVLAICPRTSAAWRKRQRRGPTLRLEGEYDQEMKLRLSVQKFGENDPVTLGIKRQIDEIDQEKLSGQGAQMQLFEAGFRKGKERKRRKAGGPPFQAGEASGPVCKKTT